MRVRFLSTASFCFFLILLPFPSLLPLGFVTFFFADSSSFLPFFFSSFFILPLITLFASSPDANGATHSARVCLSLPLLLRVYCFSPFLFRSSTRRPSVLFRYSLCCSFFRVFFHLLSPPTLIRQLISFRWQGGTIFVIGTHDCVLERKNSVTIFFYKKNGPRWFASQGSAASDVVFCFRSLDFGFCFIWIDDRDKHEIDTNTEQQRERERERERKETTGGAEPVLLLVIPDRR